MKYAHNRLSHVLKTAAFTTAACALSLSLMMGTVHAAQNIPAAADFLKRAEIIQGDSGTGELRLGDQINRAELMKIVVNAATRQVDAFEFRDCLADISAEWFARYVCWGVNNSYVAGYPDGAFHAGRAVNRAEALKIISEVFHLDYGRMVQVADDSIWYDIYVKNALRQTLLDAPLTAEELAMPATRGEVFDYLFRAMALSDSKVDNFVATQYDTYAKDYFEARENAAGTRTLTPAEDALLKTMRAQLEYGLQPLSATGSTMMKVGGKGMGMTFDVRLDLNASMKVEGTKDMLDALHEDVQLVLDVRSTGVENVSFKATADFSLAAKDDTLYVKVSSFDVVDVQAPIEAKLALNEAMDQVDTFTNQWFSITMPEMADGETLSSSIGVYKVMGTIAIDFLERSMKESGEPYFNVLLSEEGNLATLLVKPNEARINALVENIGLEVVPSANRYAVRQMTRSFDSALNMIATNTSMMLTFDKFDHLLRKVSTLIEPVTIELPQERTKFTIEAASEDYYNYDKDFTITIPTDAVDFEAFFSGGAAAEESSDEAMPELEEEMIESGSDSQM